MTEPIVNQKNRYRNLTDQRFGRLIAIKYVGLLDNYRMWLCHCDCGVEKTVSAFHLTRGAVRSCGCSRQKRNIELNQQNLQHYYHYDQGTGILTRIRNCSGNPIEPKEVGWKMNCGYIHISVFRKHILAHRAAFLYMTGRFPKNDIDHINRIRDDNRWCNLREATRSENVMNQSLRKCNTSGYQGVTQVGRRWKACGSFNRVRYHLGTYPTAQEASAAYESFAKEKHGEFYREIDYPIISICE